MYVNTYFQIIYAFSIILTRFVNYCQLCDAKIMHNAHIAVDILDGIKDNQN